MGPLLILTFLAPYTIGWSCGWFLATGTIAIPYGIHLGWNLTRFGNDWIYQHTGNSLEQGTDFNLIEGDPRILAIAVGLALIASAARLCYGIRAAPDRPRIGPQKLREIT